LDFELGSCCQSAIPVNKKVAAVTGFIAARPETMPVSTDILNPHPASVRTPTAILRKDVAKARFRHVTSRRCIGETYGDDIAGTIVDPVSIPQANS